MADALAVWMYGSRIALIEQPRSGQLRLAYTNEALERFPLGTPLLSLNLPLTAQSYPNGQTRAFLDGLLPEEDTRATVAARFNLVANDTYGLMRELGLDCAGALIVIPDGTEPPDRSTTATAEPLADEQLESLLTEIRARPLGISPRGRVRLSLAGVQGKLLLARMPDGRWGRPINGTPSTHIVKPPHAAYANTVENEAFGMRVAKLVGLPTANVEVITVGSSKALAIERYDRLISPDGTVERLHQEDLCQSLGIPPPKKYQENGGPSLAKVAQVISSAVSEPGALELLVRTTTLNVLLGNCDAHGKNFSLLHGRDGRLTIAPLYDLMSTIVYADLNEHLAMYVDTIQILRRVTADRLVNEAQTWGLARQRAATAIAELLDAMPSAVATASGDLDNLGNVPAFALQQTELLKRTL